MKTGLTDLDSTDCEILERRLAARNEVPGARNGDFVIFPSGETERLCSTPGGTHYVWEKGGRVERRNSLSVASKNSGSWELLKPSRSRNMVRFSGGMEHYYDAKLVDTGEQKPGAFCFFHHDQMKAGNGIHVQIPCRVFQLIAIGN